MDLATFKEYNQTIKEKLPLIDPYIIIIVASDKKYSFAHFILTQVDW